jgi:hypothetical protein
MALNCITRQLSPSGLGGKLIWNLRTGPLPELDTMDIPLDGDHGGHSISHSRAGT